MLELVATCIGLGSLFGILSGEGFIPGLLAGLLAAIITSSIVL